MLMTKGLDSKILYSLLIVSGFVLTIGAASAVVMYVENIELDNGAADSSIRITSSTGDSKLILEDQGKRAWSVTTLDGKNKFQITDETQNKNRFTILKNGKVGLGTANPTHRLHVQGTLYSAMDATMNGNLKVNGDITGTFIEGLLATIAANEAIIATNQVTIADLLLRISALEAGTDPTIPIISMIDTHDTQITTLEDGTDTTVPMLSMVSDHGDMIVANEQAIEDNAEAIAAGGGGNPNPCESDGDSSSLTAQELADFWTSNGIPVSENDMQSGINNIEGIVGIGSNGVLDTPIEVATWNANMNIPAGLPPC